MKTREMQTTLFYPDEAVFEPEALHYDLGKRLYDEFQARGVTLRAAFPADWRLQVKTIVNFQHAKRMVAVGVKHSLAPQPCRPSADYRLVLY